MILSRDNQYWEVVIKFPIAPDIETDRRLGDILNQIQQMEDEYEESIRLRQVLPERS